MRKAPIAIINTAAPKKATATGAIWNATSSMAAARISAGAKEWRTPPSRTSRSASGRQPSSCRAAGKVRSPPWSTSWSPDRRRTVRSSWVMR